MSAYSFEVAALTPGAGVADATNLVASTYMALAGGTTTQLSFVDEVLMGGTSGAATSPMIMLLAHDSTVIGTPTALSTPNSNGPLHPSAGVLTAPAVGAITGSVQAQRSNSITLPKKVFPFNIFGGTVRFQYANTQDRFGILGSAASLGELSLSAFTGSTASVSMGAHILYETL
jgi:hypothetical protein